MSLPELKSRIRSIEAEALAAAAEQCGDPIRGWWSCVAASGPLQVERDPHLHGVDAGVARANAIADEAIGAVILSTATSVTVDMRALIGLLCGRDATQITPTMPTDQEWMATCARIRDRQSALRDRIADSLVLIDPEAAGLVGLLLGLAARETPCVLLGSAAHAAAVIAQRQSMAASGWWRSGYCSSDPLDSIACERMQFDSWWTGRTQVLPEVLEGLLAGTISSLRSSQ